MGNKQNLSFAEQKKVIELEHKCKMEYAEFIRETERLKHEWELTRGRIKTAEIRKSQQRKKDLEFMNSYHKS